MDPSTTPNNVPVPTPDINQPLGISALNAVNEEPVISMIDRIWQNDDAANQPLSQDELITRFRTEFKTLAGQPDIQDALTFAFLDRAETELGPEAESALENALKTSNTAAPSA